MSQSKQRLLELNARLAQNLTDKGVEATADETTTTLVDKVVDIPSPKEEQEKVVEIKENGTTEILPDEDKVLSKVKVNTNVADSYYDTFWDNCQQNGERTNYNNAFSSPEFTTQTFIPKYDMYVLSCSGIFNKAGDIDVIKAFEDSGKVFDTSNVKTTLLDAILDSNITTFPILDLSNYSSGYIQSCFRQCPNLKRIQKIILPPAENQKLSLTKTFFYLCFSHLPSLEQISFEGTICGGINFASSKKLSVESAKNILTHLYNYTGTENEFVYSVLFADSVWELLNAEGATAPDNITWEEYVNSIGWNK